MASHPFNTSYSRQLALWVLRAFSPSLARDLFIRHLNCADQDNAIFLGLPPEPDADNISAIYRLLGAMLAGMEKTPAAVGLPVHAIRNFAELGHIFKLNPTEIAVLQFLACTVSNLSSLTRNA